MPDVDEEQTELEDRPSSEFFRPGSPKLTTKSVEDQEDHGTTTSGLGTDAKLFRHASDGIAVQTCVEVHRDLNDEDDGQNRPLLPCRKAETEFFVAVIFCQNDLVGAIVCVASLLLAGRYFGVVDSAFDRGVGRVGILDLFVGKHARHLECNAVKDVL